MEKVLKRSLSFLLAITIIFSSAYVGLNCGLVENIFSIKAKATNESSLVFTLNGSGEDYSITACDISVSGGIVIPNTYNGLPVSAIASKTFAGCYNLTSVAIPESITTIGDKAFSYCRSLASVTIPGSVLSIGVNAFESCYNLFFVNLGEGVEVISAGAFSYCRNLKNILFPESLNNVGQGAFLKCVSLEKVYYKGPQENWVNISIANENQTLNEAQTVFDYGYDKIYSGVYNTDDKIEISYSGHSNVDFIVSDTSVAEIKDISTTVNTTGKTYTKTIKLDMVNEAGVKFTYGEVYTSAGKYVTGKQGVAGSEFIPVENYDANIEGYNATCCVWDKNKKFIRGYDKITSDVILDPAQGDAYVTVCVGVNESDVNADGTINGKSASRFIITRDVEIAETSKTFEIFGDSISTFDGYIVEGNVPFYSTDSLAPSGYTSDVTDVSQTWWKKLEAETGMKLVRNDSYSGRCLSYMYYGGKINKESSFVTAVERRFVDKSLENPDVFVIYGGVNDICAATSVGGVGKGNNLGTAKYSDWSEEDLKMVGPALCYMVDLIQKNAPESEIVFIIDRFVNAVHPTYGDLIKSICAYYGVEVCGLSRGETIGDVHPNSAGMIQIKDGLLSVLSNESCCFEFCSVKATYTEIQKPEITINNVGETEIKVVDEYGNIVDVMPLLIVEGEHKFNLISTEKQPTCTETGTGIYKCKFCGLEEKQKLSVIGHDFPSEWTIDKVATCTEDGSKSHHCIVCGEKKDVTTIPATGHSNKTATTKATLTQNGKVETKCTVCGYVSKTTVIYSPKTIKLSTATCTYNGKERTPSVTVKDSNGNVLVNGADYKVSVPSGRKLPGIYKYTITFMGKYSGTKTLDFTILPKAPTTISATQTTSTITLNWSESAGATGYRVYQYSPSQGKYVQVASVKGVTSYKKTTNFKAGTEYSFKVKPYTKLADGTVLWGVASEAFVTATKCNAPSITSVVSPSKSKATVKWSNVDGETGYQLYYATSKNGTYKKINSYGADVLTGTKTFSASASGKTIYFKARAYKKVNGQTIFSSWSAVKSVKLK